MKQMREKLKDRNEAAARKKHEKEIRMAEIKKTRDEEMQKANLEIAQLDLSVNV